MAILGDLPGGGCGSDAYAASFDGAVVVGVGSSESGDEAFRWDESGGLLGLGFLQGCDGSAALATSASGSVIVGYGCAPSAGGPAFEREAFRWTEQLGMVGLRDLSPDGFIYSEAFDVSADGLVVVGSAANGNGSNSEAFRWTPETGMVGLGVLSNGGSSGARGVSADGSVVVGWSYTGRGGEAFRWTAGTGMVGLGHLSGESTFGEALDVSEDGSVIVGVDEGRVFIWDATHGMRALESVLQERGVDLMGWSLWEARSISYDGWTIAGVGATDPDGNYQAWVATLPPECRDAVDNDGDGLVDFPDDPGCPDPDGDVENPQCQDGLNNDAPFDALIDFDGGQSIHGPCSGGVCPPGVSDPNHDGVANPDPHCSGPTDSTEGGGLPPGWGCGLGPELALLIPALLALRRRSEN